jgi:putative ABC transport system ATP-binding protein
MAISTPEVPVSASTKFSDHSDPLFSARSLTKIYAVGDLEVTALNGVDLGLFRGNKIIMLGTSGSGKSTLLNIWAG